MLKYISLVLVLTIKIFSVTCCDGTSVKNSEECKEHEGICNSKTIKSFSKISFPGWSYCTDSNPCPVGYGDCDSDSQCQSGLTCSQDVGANYGWSSSVDVCEVASPKDFPGWSYCTDSNPCPVGYGDCDSDSQCQSGLTCSQDVGANYGWKSSVDVCEVASPKDFPGWSYCTDSNPCPVGYGDCDSDSQCQSGLTCSQDVGANYGWKSSVDVCEATSTRPFLGWDYCSDSNPCPAGYGDCDSDSQCQSGLTCNQDVGANYGWSSSVDVCEASSSVSNKIIGKITYDRVHVNSNNIGLNYNNITAEPAKQVVVKAIKIDGTEFASTVTNDNGEYEFDNLPLDTQIKIRVYAQLDKAGTGGWSVKVIDNVNNNAQYVMESSYITIKSSVQINLNADSGWSGDSYSNPRTAAPFAILDNIYQSIQKVKNTDATATFPALTINWSPNNIAAQGDISSGQIGTSYFDGVSSIYLLGDENGDTDEYDDHVIIHEWGHYFEHYFSRADSIGGSHWAGDYLDIRVAFGEGWANAWSAIATDNPIYFDTSGVKQSSGFYMNIESETPYNAGYFSEASIQRILYDLYDNNNDGADTLSFGFSPIYRVLIYKEKNTPAFTSIFSFITYLKEDNSPEISKIDDILDSESIGSIQNIYGSSIAPDIYSTIYNDKLDNICTSSKYGTYNKLYNHRYIKFNISQSANYTIKVKQRDNSNSDPDFYIFKTSPFKAIAISESSNAGEEELNYSFDSGDYLLDLYDYNNLSSACFDISIY